MDCYEEGDALHGAKIVCGGSKDDGASSHCEERQA